MKTFIHIFISLIVASLSVSCASPSVTKISAEQAYTMMSELDEGNFLIIDVRSFDEFNSGHIRGAIPLPYAEITADLMEKIADPNMVILVYCQRGRRSAIGAQKIADLGFTNVYDFGGLDDWPFDLETNVPTTSEGLNQLFFQWATTESGFVASQVMRAFQVNIALFIEALTDAEPFVREQVLMLVGAAFAEARVNNPTLYVDYIATLEFAETLNLSAEQRRVLGFIRANVVHASR